MADFGISEALSIAQAAGSLFKAGGSYQSANNYQAAGAAARVAADFKAAQLRQNAGQAIAASQRKSIEDKNQAALLASKMIAAAGASGGTGPQVNKLVADIFAKGSYNRSMDLYNGEETARQMRLNADVAEYQGYVDELGMNSRASASRTAGTGDLFTGGLTLLQNYGRGGPSGGGIAAGAGISGAINWDLAD